MIRGRRAHAVRALVLLALAGAGCAAGRDLARPESGRPHVQDDPLLARRCGGCHAVPDPSSLTEERWLRGLERMRKRVTLSAEEWDSLASLHGRATRRAPSEGDR